MLILYSSAAFNGARCFLTIPSESPELFVYLLNYNPMLCLFQFRNLSKTGKNSCSI